MQRAKKLVPSSTPRPSWRTLDTEKKTVAINHLADELLTELLYEYYETKKTQRAALSVLKCKVFWFVLSQTVLNLIKFIEKNNNILNVKWE